MNILRRVCFLALTTLMCLMVSSCAFFAPLFFSFDKSAFYKAKSQWEELGIQNYTYSYYSVGFMSEYVSVTVESGEYVSSEPLIIKFSDTDEGYESSLSEYEYSINDIFDSIESKYLSGKSTIPFFESVYITGIDVTYNETYHFPSSVQYSYYTSPLICVDGNFGFEIIDFVPSN